MNCMYVNPVDLPTGVLGHRLTILCTDVLLDWFPTKARKPGLSCC